MVAAKHRAGSLDAFVERYRRWNLSLGFGVVMILGVRFAFLVLAARRAQWLAERQIEFAAGVSHELRTPIAGISSLRQKMESEPQHPRHILTVRGLGYRFEN